MRQPHLLRVESPPEAFSSLISAAREAGSRVGWLDLDPVAAPETLDSAASQGVLRAVAVGGGRVVSVKPLSGPPVLADLLREYFRGCRAVLVRGPIDAPWLVSAEPEKRGREWVLRRTDGSERLLDTQALVKRLRSPRPLAEPATWRC